MVSVVVDDGHVVLGVIHPSEDHPPLFVDPNAPESLQIAFQLLKAIARWNPKILNDPCLIDHPELSPGSFLDVPRQGPDPQATVDAFSREIAEAFDHG
jgi:hypothetical protein